MSSSTFEVREPESESEKVVDFGLDACEENGLETSHGDGEVPRDHTYTKEPDNEEKDEVKDSDAEEAIMDTVEEAATPKKKGGRPSRGNKSGKTTTGKGKTKKEAPVKKEPVSKKGKKKETVAEEENTASEESAKNGEAEAEVESPVVAEELPKASKRGKKRKVEEKENVIDQSIMDEVQNITEDAAAANEISAENSPKKAKTPVKTPKVKSPVKAKVSSDDSEDSANLPKGWTKKTVVRKSGKTAGMMDVYIYSPDGLKFRSKPDVAAYLAKIKSPLKIDDFDFSKRKSVSSNSTSAPSPKTPVKAKTPVKTKPPVEKKKTPTPKKSPKLVVKISVSKKKKSNKTEDNVKDEKKSKTPVKAAKAKSTISKGSKNKKTA